MAKSIHKKTLSTPRAKELLKILQARFNNNESRHKNIKWTDVQQRLLDSPQKLWSLSEMETTGGEPDLVDFNPTTGEFMYMDCAAESPAGRRSVCYDREGLDARKEFKPRGNAIEMAQEMGIEILNEEQYKSFNASGMYDKKTSSWLKTNEEVRKLGGALFGDFRFGRVFIYHNGAQSYYAARGFRGYIWI
jgi:Protein of unknown function (DUF4256)